MDNVIFEQMLQKKNADLDRRSYLYDIVKLVNNLKYLKIPKSFKEAISSEKLTYIHEFSNFSEKVDDLNFDFEITDISDKNINFSAVSAVTNGSNAKKIISRIRDITDVPVLMRDFVISPLQIFEAKEAGASAFTIIPSIISYKSLIEFVILANGLELECVPEISDKADVSPLIDAGVKYLLVTPDLSCGTDNFIKMLSCIPRHIVTIVRLASLDADMLNTFCESGVNCFIV